MLSTGRVLGGTGLSNPMKSFFGIEKLKLKGRKVDGGYIVRGALPWVSNLGPDHYLRHHLRREDEPGAAGDVFGRLLRTAITLTPCKPFLAMDGTGTYGVQLRDVFVPDELILADPAAPFVKKIRAGFILLQAGMALGLIKDCINIMDEVDTPSATSTAICRNSRCTSANSLPSSRPRPWRWRAIPTTRRRPTGAR